MAIVAGAYCPASAALISLPSAADNTLFQSEFGDLSNGSGQYFFCGTTAFGDLRRGLIEFDIAGSIPAGSTIISATLKLHMSRTAGAAAPVSLHRTLADWGEGASIGFGEEGGGAPSLPGDATWIHTHYSTGLWATPGGDFDPDPSATSIIFGVEFYNWTSAQLAADVQSWLDNPTANHGWLLLGDEEFPFSAKRFDTRENIDPAVRPVLTIEYQPVPEPANLWCLMTAMALLRRGRGQRKSFSVCFTPRHRAALGAYPCPNSRL